MSHLNVNRSTGVKWGNLIQGLYLVKNNVLDRTVNAITGWVGGVFEKCCSPYWHVNTLK